MEGYTYLKGSTQWGSKFKGVQLGVKASWIINVPATKSHVIFRFEYTIGDEESEKKLFSVPDYIGFATRNIGSRIRGTAARTSFDEFHRYSTRIVTEAVFGRCKTTGKE